MENCVFRCERCDDELLLSDIVGMGKLQNAIGWQDQQELWGEWLKAIEQYKIEHIC